MVWLTRLVLNVAILGLILKASPASASPFAYQGPGISGHAANALIKAYEASGFDKNVAPPFELQSYVVTIDRMANDEFDVTFASETKTEHRDIVVDFTTGAVGTPSPQSTSVPADGVALPGIAAGAIVVAYSRQFENMHQSPLTCFLQERTIWPIIRSQVEPMSRSFH